MTKRSLPGLLHKGRLPEISVVRNGNAHDGLSTAALDDDRFRDDAIDPTVGSQPRRGPHGPPRRTGTRAESGHGTRAGDPVCGMRADEVEAVHAERGGKRRCLGSNRRRETLLERDVKIEQQTLA